MGFALVGYFPDNMFQFLWPYGIVNSVESNPLGCFSKWKEFRFKTYPVQPHASWVIIMSTFVLINAGICLQILLYPYLKKYLLIRNTWEFCKFSKSSGELSSKALSLITVSNNRTDSHLPCVSQGFIFQRYYFFAWESVCKSKRPVHPVSDDIGRTLPSNRTESL